LKESIRRLSLMLMDEYKNDTVIKEDILDKCPYCAVTTWKV
jgi:hypothetical protein